MCARERASGFADLCVGCDGLLEDGEGARRELLLLRLLLPFLDRRGAHGGVTRHGCWRAPLFRVCACRPRGKTHTRGGFSFAFPFSFFDFGFNILTARPCASLLCRWPAALHACTPAQPCAQVLSGGPRCVQGSPVSGHHGDVIIRARFRRLHHRHVRCSPCRLPCESCVRAWRRCVRGWRCCLRDEALCLQPCALPAQLASSSLRPGHCSHLLSAVESVPCALALVCEAPR